MALRALNDSWLLRQSSLLVFADDIADGRVALVAVWQQACWLMSSSWTPRRLSPNTAIKIAQNINKVALLGSTQQELQ